MRLVIKVGGAQLETTEGRTAFADSVASARAAGHDVIVVHGGGAQLKRLCADVGLSELRYEGLRVTCARTSELALGVLGGIVNKTLVRALEQGGVAAVGLTGADGSSYAARKYTADGVDLGYVGEVARVDSTLIDALLAGGFVPVLASVAPLADGEPHDAEHLYNVNADTAAGTLAAALDADALLLLTDVEAVRDAQGADLAALDAGEARRLMRDGVLQGGMLPKVRAALAALDAARGREALLVKIASANAPDAVLAALGANAGTRLTATAEEIARG